MRKSALNHPLWVIELAAAPGVAALLWAALLFPDDRFIVGVLLGLLSGVLIGAGVTLAVTRWAVPQASAPGGLLGEVVEGKYREVAR